MKEKREYRDEYDSLDMGFGEDRNGLPIICSAQLQSNIKKSAGVSEGDYMSMVQESQGRQEYLNLEID